VVGCRCPILSRDVVGQRLGRLSPAAEELLSTAAVVGLAFDLDLVAEVGGLPLAQMIEQIEQVERVALVNEIGAGRYSFSHAIVRSTLLDRMPPPIDYLWLSTMQSFAELAAGLGRADVCEQVLSQLTPFRGWLGVTSSGAACYGLVSRTLGQLAIVVGQVDLAIELLDEVVAQADAIGAPYEATSARRYLAVALLAAGRRLEEVETLVAAAAAMAADHGFAGEQRELGLVAPGR
jgi:hypothetical protein